MKVLKVEESRLNASGGGMDQRGTALGHSDWARTPRSMSGWVETNTSTAPHYTLGPLKPWMDLTQEKVMKQMYLTTLTC